MLQGYHFWTPFAFIRIVVFFGGGILAGIYSPDIISQQAATLVFLLAVLIYALLFIVQKMLKHELITTGAVALAGIFMSGYVHVFQHTGSRNPNHIVNLGEQVQYYQVVINSDPEVKNKSYKLEAKVQQVKTESGWKHYEARIYLYISKKDFQQPFQYGDVLLIHGSPQEIKAPANPGEFDYKRFLTFRNIYHQHFVRNREVVFLKNDPPNHLYKYTLQVRAWAANALRNAINGEQEQAIVCALVLGIKDSLDNELITAYAATGSMHVLAVSGLHVGILYIILGFVFRPIKKKKYGRILFVCVSLGVLWAYACITGFSPSVLRAVTMFTFVALAQAFRQRSNIYNTLAISAFALLLFDPFLIMSVGFQLSYLAVLGIVYLHRPLYLLYEAKTRLGNMVWKISCVSIAAQIATFSLGMLYFHQFPNYFLFSNLFVIPLATGILVGGLMMLTMSAFEVVADWPGMALSAIIKLLNFLVFKIESLPFNLIDDIYISTFQCWLITTGVITFILFFQLRKINYLYAGFCLFLIFSLAQWHRFYEQVNHTRLTVYQVAGHMAYALTDNGHSFFFGDSALYNDREKIRFHIRPDRLIANVRTVVSGDRFPFASETDFGKVMTFKGKTILHVMRPFVRSSEKISADFVVVSNNAIQTLADLTSFVDATQTIFDSTNSLQACSKVLSEAAVGSLTNVHSVLHSGAFEMIW